MRKADAARGADRRFGVVDRAPRLGVVAVLLVSLAAPCWAQPAAPAQSSAAPSAGGALGAPSASGAAPQATGATPTQAATEVVPVVPTANTPAANAPAADAPAANAAAVAAPTVAVPALAVPIPSVPASMLPANLSVSAMFLHADIVVQCVMAGLILASVVTWTILLAKGIELMASGRSLRRAVQQAEAEVSLVELLRKTGGNAPAGAMAAAAEAEIAQSAGADHGGIKERIASRLRRIEARFARSMNRGTGLLATIGSTAPFIGLFGTVWGIMNSFIGISKTQTTNLAVVAPGIAEALLATAAGLIAAIPAVVIYNMFSRGIGGYRSALTDLAASVERLASRELDLRRRPLRAAAE